MEIFDFICRLRGLNGTGPDGRAYDAAELVEQMRRDPAWGELFRSGVEHHWSTTNREASLQWMRLLVNAARYLSDLIGAEVPVLAPREFVDASAGIRRGGDHDALLIGRVVQRSIAAHITHNMQITNAELLNEIRHMLNGKSRDAVPAASRWLSTREIAARLALDDVTVARLCRKGQIQAEKTAGGQWRATEEMLRRSPYLNGRRRLPRRRASGELE